MFTVLWVSVVVFLAVVLLMSLGVLLGRKPLRSGCAAAREDLNIACAAGCKTPCFKRRVKNFLKERAQKKQG